MAKKKDKKIFEYTTKGGLGGGGLGVTAGLIKGGSIGVAGFFGATGLPLFVTLGVAGVTAGAIGGIGYYGFKKVLKKSKKKK